MKVCNKPDKRRRRYNLRREKLPPLATATVPTVAARQARPDVRDAISVTACYATTIGAKEFTPASETLFGLEARGLQHGAPLGNLGADEGVELLGAVADQLEALRREPRLHLRVLRDLPHLGVQALDDRPRRARRPGEAAPAIDLVAREAAFSHRGNVGRERSALSPCHGQSLEIARLH